MPSYILDTHTLLWHLNKSKNLSETAREIITSPANSIFVCVASYWEMAIKSSLGKLELPVDIETLIHENERDGILTIPIEASYLALLRSMQFHHRDPFDRMIIATAKVLNYPLLSKDDVFEFYDVELNW